MQAVDFDIHKRFTHESGVSAIKKDNFDRNANGMRVPLKVDKTGSNIQINEP